MKITRKPEAPEPMEISTGNAYYVNFEEVVTSLPITYKKMGKCVLYSITILKKIFTYFWLRELTNERIKMGSIHS